MPGSSNQCSLTTEKGGRRVEAGREAQEGGTSAHLRLIHVDAWQKPTQHRKATILQLKINKLKK